MKLAASCTLVMLACAVATSAVAQTQVDVVKVVSKPVERQVRLPGEFQPYLAVPIYAKVSGFVQRVNVDRGSVVKQGQLLATLDAPEMQAQIAEAESRAQAVELQRTEAEAKLASAQSTYDRLKAASATPGVVAENDVQVSDFISKLNQSRLFRDVNLVVSEVYVQDKTSDLRKFQIEMMLNPDAEVREVSADGKTAAVEVERK